MTLNVWPHQYGVEQAMKQNFKITPSESGLDIESFELDEYGRMTEITDPEILEYISGSGIEINIGVCRSHYPPNPGVGCPGRR
jgi:hypothetical protein